jgi:hypothetical protein
LTYLIISLIRPPRSTEPVFPQLSNDIQMLFRAQRRHCGGF